MAKSDEYRAKAEECRLMAGKVTTAIDQAAWLGLATDWLGLIRDPARTASERSRDGAGSRNAPTEVFR